MGDLDVPCSSSCLKSRKTNWASRTDLWQPSLQLLHLIEMCACHGCLILPYFCSSTASISTAVTSTPGKVLSTVPLSASSWSSIFQARPFHGNFVSKTDSVKQKSNCPLHWYLFFLLFLAISSTSAEVTSPACKGSLTVLFK